MSNKIDFVIGGKDKAKPALDGVEKSLERLEKKTDAVAKSTKTLTALGGTLAAAYGLVKTALAALGGLDKINAAFEQQAAAVRGLENALRIRGAQSASDDMQKFASELQKLSGIGDEVTLGLMRQAASMGIATDRIDDATKAAVGLSEATGKSLEASLADVTEALKGNFEAFHGINPQIMWMRSNIEKLNAVMEIAQQGLDVQSRNMYTAAGASSRASGAIGDLMEVIGQIIEPIRVLINAGLQKMAETLQVVLAPAAEYAKATLENIGPIVEWVREKVVQAINVMVGAFTFFETVIMNFGDVWELLKASAELSMLSVAGFIKQTLTVRIPEYAKWFAENFVNLFRDAFNAVVTVVTNAGKIIGEAVYQIFEFIASGGAGGINQLMADMGQAASMSLMDGFQSSLTALPEIAERTLTQREKDLAERIGAIGGRLGKEFSDKMEERMIGVGSTLGDELKNAAKGIDLKGRKAAITQSIQVTEGRLLTRGPGSALPDKLDHIIRLMQQPPKAPRILVDAAQKQNDFLKNINDNTKGKLQLEAIV